MRKINEDLQAHLDTGATTLCRAWIVSRMDGFTFGFTDHDKALIGEGVSCEAASSMDATAVESTTGLSVDNTQAVGVLSSLGITDLDVETGKFDGAEVRHFLVNWRDTSQTILQFRGTLGEIRRGSGGFEAELRGLSEALNKPIGRAYMRQCDRVLGDRKCKVDIFASGFMAEDEVYTSSGRRIVELQHLGAFADDWFVNGKATWITGANAGANGLIKVDRKRGLVHIIELWEETKFPIENGDILRVHAGCDKHVETCKTKFSNFQNFRGFPHIPGEDWSVAYPVSGTEMDGDSRE
jgi:uncharacterized phage protein (TIGR02218 family)